MPYFPLSRDAEGAANGPTTSIRGIGGGISTRSVEKRREPPSTVHEAKLQPQKHLWNFFKYNFWHVLQCLFRGIRF